jgi:hypothetical protein
VAARDPEPVLADGRHPVYLTDVDVTGGTVEFDLLQYLTGDAAEAYEAAHPDEYDDEYDHSPLHNDNPRLRRLPVASDALIVVQGTTAEVGGEAHTIAFADLLSYFGDAERHDGHLGYQAFWLGVHDGTVETIEELQPAG